MRNSKSYKYKNYGSTPRNEYTKTNKKNNTTSVAVLELATQEDDMMYEQHSPKQHVQYQPRYGWKRSWKSNGWRAESASLQNEFAGMGRSVMP